MGGFFEDKKRPGRWIVYFKGHNYRLDANKQPLYSPKQANKMLGYLQTQYDKDPARFDHQQYGRDRRMLVENAWETYMAESPCGYARMKQRQQMFEAYVFPYFGKRYVKDIHFVDLDEWVRGLRGASSYIKTIVSTFRHFFKFWHQREMLDRIPGFPSITVPRKEIRWLTQEQQAQVHEFIPAQHLPIFTFLRDYGRRSSEACGLRREDIDLAKNQIRIRNTKTGKIDLLPIGPDFGKWISSTTNLFYVFSTQTGKPYTRQILYNAWRYANRKANEKYGTPIVSNYEGTRKSFACQRIGSYDLSLISACMGHSDTRTTQAYYGKVETKKLGEVVEIHSPTASKSQTG